MVGGITFHFVTDGIHSALKQAKDAAGGQDVRLGSGISTIRQYLSAGLIDELHPCRNRFQFIAAYCSAIRLAAGHEVSSG